MMTSCLTQPYAELLSPLANPHKAREMTAYMRGQFAFLGISTPQRRGAYRPLLKVRLPAASLLSTAQTLWTLPEREYQYAAVDLINRQWQQLNTEHIPALLALAQQKSWWDTVDGLAGAVGDIIKREKANKAQALMDEALTHPNLWVRRITMIHQLGWRGDTDETRLFAYALKLAPETDFFIRKAIGWALRDYARHAPEAIRSFLQTHRATLSGLTVREAGKHL